MDDLPSKREDEISNPIYPGLRRGIFAGSTKFDQVIKLNKKSGKQCHKELVNTVKSQLVATIKKGDLKLDEEDKSTSWNIFDAPFN